MNRRTNRYFRAIGGNDGSVMTFWLIISQVMAAGTAFLVNILAARVMNPDDRGYLAWFLQIGYLVSTIGLLGIERPFVSFVKTDFRFAVNSMLGLVRPSYIFVSLTVLAGVFFWISNQKYFAISTWIISVFVVANIHSRIIRSAYIASGEWRPFVRNSVVIQLSLLGLSFLLIALDRGSLHEWLAIYLISNMVATLLVVQKRNKAIMRRFRTEEVYSRVRRQGIKLIPASMGNAAMLKSDRLLLPFLSSPAELGLYVVAATSMDMASWPIQQWVDGKLHAWRSAQLSTTQLIKLLLKVSLVVLLLTALIGLCVSLIIAKALPISYAKSQTLLIPLGIAVFIYSLTRVLHGQMIARSIVAGVSVSETVGMIAAMLCYFILIPALGSLGAAYGSIVGYSLSFAIAAVYWTFNSKKV